RPSRDGIRQRGLRRRLAARAGWGRGQRLGRGRAAARGEPPPVQSPHRLAPCIDKLTRLEYRMALPDRIAKVLGPHLGDTTADIVARHLCAKHEIGEGPVDAAKAEQLQETLRRGLVAFVGTDRAKELSV